MDCGTWWATVHRVARVRHDWVTKPPPTPHRGSQFQSLLDHTFCTRMEADDSEVHEHNLKEKNWRFLACERLTLDWLSLGWKLLGVYPLPLVPQNVSLSNPVSCLFFFFLLLHCTAYEILVPSPGIEPGPLWWKRRFLTTGPGSRSL